MPSVLRARQGLDRLVVPVPPPAKNPTQHRGLEIGLDAKDLADLSTIDVAS